MNDKELKARIPNEAVGQTIETKRELEVMEPNDVEVNSSDIMTLGELADLNKEIALNTMDPARRDALADNYEQFHKKGYVKPDLTDIVDHVCQTRGDQSAEIDRLQIELTQAELENRNLENQRNTGVGLAIGFGIGWLIMAILMLV